MRETLLLLGVCFTFMAYSQSELQTIFKSTRQFDEIVTQGEAYFRDKHPNIPFHELTIGEHRDGEFVKFMRWQKFWSERLNSDGRLGDPSAFWRKQRSKNTSNKGTSPYANVPWTNISYEDYIISQIGLGRTTSMAFHPTLAATFYVGAAIGGIWKTTDGGQTYTPLGDNLPFLPISSIVVDQQTPTTIYIAVSDHVWYGPGSIGVYKSTDGGSSWVETALTFNLGNDIRIYWMEADPNDPDIMMVATENGTYRTTDGFATVNRVSTTSSFSVRYMPGNSSTIYVGGTSGQFLKSTDGGTSFNQITDFGSGNVLIAVTALDLQKVFARNGSNLHQSFNAGTSFTQTSSFNTSSEVFTFALTNDDIIVSGNFDCHRSNNEGASFSQITHWLNNNGLPNIHVDQRNLFTNPLEPDAVYFCNDGGVYRYSVSNNTFTNLSDGLLITQFYDIAVSQTNSNVIGGGSQDNGNVFRNASGSWIQYANTGDGMNQEIDPTNADLRYWAYQNGGMRRWENGGNTSIAPSGQDGNGAWETPFKLDPSDSDRLICAYDVVYESFNNGDSWNTISGQLSNGSDMNELAIAPTNGERIYVTQGGTLFVKNVANDSWTTKSLPNGSVSDIEVDFGNMDILYVCVPGYDSGEKVYKSTDAGSSWTNISGTLPNVSVGALEMFQGTAGGVFIGTDAGVYYRDNDLSDWLEYGELPHTRVEDIEIQYSANKIRVGTHGRGVLEASIEVEACTASSADSDGDGFCDLIDTCPGFDNSLLGEACDDGDVFSVGEYYTANCECEGGAADIDYCAAAGSNGTGSDYINRVQLETIDNSSGKTAYSDFRSLSARLDHGGSYPVSVSLQAVFSPDRVHVWIDYDRSGTFEASEATAMSIPSNNISSGMINVPMDAVKGATTMRVRVVYSTTFDDPCGNAFGEVEDYTVFLDCVAGSTHVQCNLLPLDWLSFTAHQMGQNKAILNWETANEQALSHFEIERSFDGRLFTEIGVQQALSNRAGDKYSFLDEQIGTHEAYYRIKAVDLDGSTDFTEIRHLIWKGVGLQKIAVYPNPVTDKLKLDLTGIGIQEQFNWSIENMYGQTIRKGWHSTLNGESIIDIPLINLPTGTYLLRSQWKNDEFTRTFIKGK